ncbi:MAG: HlyD family type I secretion periplasmic adaptor subunit [Anaplasmataceae bacterium]|nr:HlyD family type I secretion periplasmic adaptor subunit [Anaplasmataceae bacterium]
MTEENKNKIEIGITTNEKNEICSTVDVNKKEKANDNLKKRVKSNINFGLIIIFIFFGIFGSWAAFAPLDGSIIAQGSLESPLKRQSIQHLEGGVIEKFFANEGDTVLTGDPIIKLNDVASTANLSSLYEKLSMMEFTRNRLIAERDNLPFDEIDWNLDVTAKTKNMTALSNQQRLFKINYDALNGKIKILNGQIEHKKYEIDGIKEQIASFEKQYNLYKDEFNDKQKLFKEGIVDKPTFSQIEKQYISISGQLGEYKNRLLQASEKLDEISLEIINFQNQNLQNIIKELKDVSANINELKERILSNEDLVKRTLIVSPIDGEITGLKYHTIGGVISPGSIVTDIVPTQDSLVAKVMIQPMDIESILHVMHSDEGAFVTQDENGNRMIEAKIRILSLNARKVGMLDAYLTKVSADSVEEIIGNSRGKVYTGEVIINKEEINSLKKNGFILYPGMPVAVYIKIASRTLLSYLIMPITSAFTDAFRER